MHEGSFVSFWGAFSNTLSSPFALPIQDVLNLDETHRMNAPGFGGRSWQWRLQSGQLTVEAAAKLLKLTLITGRA
ncbi:4-alpha-glucanotransferase [Spirosoma arcticum]